MNVGILTFFDAINYGASLQAAALRHVLQEQGADVSFMDHRCGEVEKTSLIWDWKQAGSPAYALAHLYNLPVALRRRENFRKFWEKHYRIGSENPGDYDVVVAGSDQIWNYGLSGDDWFYFLNFSKEKAKKVSYAASFGLSQIPEDKQKVIAPLLRDMDRISVREQTGAALVKEMTGRDVPVVLDPTLLLNKAQWKSFADPDFTDKGYIFVYTVFNSDSLWERAYALSKETGLPIRTISYSKLHRKNAIYTFDAGPVQWLSHIMNAEYVVTNSFHGFAFSVNFEKQFYYELTSQKTGVSSRLSDMARQYGLTHREISQKDGSPIAYEAVREKLEEARQHSMAYIRSFLD